jgi:hypothetical protein
MERTEITAAVVAKFDRLFSKGTTLDEIVHRLGITLYVARLLAQSPGHALPNIKTRKTGRRVRNIQRGVDVATIRRIQRMLVVGQLNHQEIAREAGVSANLVADVASGKRAPVSHCQPVLDQGESYVRHAHRCRGCGGLLVVIPCRACRVEVVSWMNHFFSRGGISQSPFSASRLFAVLMVSVQQHLGADVMQNILSRLAIEITGLANATDKREFLIRRCEAYFDELVEPVDMPGPDPIVDPVLRATIRPLVGKLYDEAVRKLEAQTHAA